MASMYKRQMFELHDGLSEIFTRKSNKIQPAVKNTPSVKKKTELDKIKEELDESPINSLIDEVMESNNHAS
jgi:proline dehydrogenase